jgi:hypothetical protein
MDFSNLAYAKINLDYDSNLFCSEYDAYIFNPDQKISNNHYGNLKTAQLNKSWNMVPEDMYTKVDSYIQKGESTVTLKKVYRTWNMTQLMELDTSDISDPVLLKYSKFGGTALRNEALALNFNLKPQYKDLQIVKWIYENLPFQKIVSIHCVSLDAGSFATIH